MTQPIFRLFKLGLDLNYQDDYDKVGYTNLTTSIQQESGTLAMFVNHVSGHKEQQVVVEVYADETAYQEHVAADHFKAFAAVASQALISREVISLDAQILLQKPQALRVTKGNKLSVRLAHVVVRDNQAFSDIVLSEMKTSMAVEDGVLLMYAGRDKEQPDHWYFYEIYADQAAYDSHCQSKHFKDYIAGTADLVREKSLQVLIGDILVTKGD